MSQVQTGQSPQSPQSPQIPSGKARMLLWGILPVLLLIGIITAIMIMGTGIDEKSPVPIESLDVEKTVLTDSGITLNVLNSGPQELAIAQVMVDDAYWNFNIVPQSAIPRMGRATITIPYPWIEGDAHEIRMISSESTIFNQTIEVAFKTPEMSGERFGKYALIGLYVGVVPIVLGLMWFPFMRRFSVRGMHAVLAFTAGLLIFLVVDTFQEGFEFAAAAPSIFHGTGLVWFGALLSFLLLAAIDQSNRRKARNSDAEGRSLAYKLATGIGLHNFGEGLAIGTAFAVGEAALGTFLIIGFTLHNITEGIGIAAPLTKATPTWKTFAWLALIGGGPAILGVWSGGLILNNTLAALCFGIGAGAIAQVIYVIARMIMKESVKHQYSLFSWRNFSSVALGIVVMYATALLVTA
ncbi:ZIP family metal transporter [Paenibacillus eucommiae]|uniref:Zinc transporter ZupT n=1 Tax=Paenibacillus eucommiae TaxID=1355755 RepID=A0ABS4J958_9BACL|nr:ZIP family metal transporter [Paenibacillus eucommiae]MBP1996377.1 zinc transporter ZupT [Paenibacillus eucommiae]